MLIVPGRAWGNENIGIQGGMKTDPALLLSVEGVTEE